jgi:hypothetical protein
MLKLHRLWKAVAVLHKNVQAKRTLLGPLSATDLLDYVGERPIIGGHSRGIQLFCSHAESNYLSKSLNKQNESELKRDFKPINHDFHTSTDTYKAESENFRSQFEKDELLSSPSKAAEAQVLDDDQGKVEDFGYFEDEQEHTERVPEKCIPISLQSKQILLWVGEGGSKRREDCVVPFILKLTSFSMNNFYSPMGN